MDFDLLILGAGPAGLKAARLAAAAGWRVALVEEGRIGGTALWRGAVAKALLAVGAGFAAELDDMAGFGWDVGSAVFDWGRLAAAKHGAFNRLEAVHTQGLRESGVTLLHGRGRLLGPHTVAAGGRTVTARHLLIATGSRPLVPDWPGIEHAVGPDQALDLMHLPPRLAVIGDSPVAVEFASLFQALGTEVTLVVAMNGFLPGFDDDLRASLAAAMVGRGVRLVAGAVASIERAGGSCCVRLEGGAAVAADVVLCAVGRRPNSDGIGLAEAGVRLNAAGAVMVDFLARTSLGHIHAVGDVTDRLGLAPVAEAEAAAVIGTLCHGRSTPLRFDAVPVALASLPPAAAVGLSEAEAMRRYGGADIYHTRVRPLRTLLSGRDEMAMVKLVTERGGGRVLGLHLVGEGAAEAIQGFAVALTCGVTKTHIDSTLGIHPTFAEAVMTLKERREGELS